MTLLTKELSWKHHDLAKVLLENYDERMPNSEENLLNYLESVEKRFKEAKFLIKKYPDNPVVAHNYSLLSMVRGLLLVGYNSVPRAS